MPTNLSSIHCASSAHRGASFADRGAIRGQRIHGERRARQTPCFRPNLVATSSKVPAGCEGGRARRMALNHRCRRRLRSIIFFLYPCDVKVADCAFVAAISVTFEPRELLEQKKKSDRKSSPCPTLSTYCIPIGRVERAGSTPARIHHWGGRAKHELKRLP